MRQTLRYVVAVLALSLGGCAQVAWFTVMAPSAAAEAVTRSHRTVTLTVVDADTGQSMPNVEVVMRFGGWFDPDGKAFVTDAAGQAKHRLVVNRSGQFDVHAAGYYPQSMGLAPDPLPTTYTIRVLRKPIPYHVLEVPNGFRGTLILDLPPREEPRRTRAPSDPDWPAGKRAWITLLRPDAPTTLPSIPLVSPLADDLDLVIRVQTPDGAPLPVLFDTRYPMALPDESLAPCSTKSTAASSLGSDEVAVWEIASDLIPRVSGIRRRMYLFVGTQPEAAEAQRLLKASIYSATNRKIDCRFPPLQ